MDGGDRSDRESAEGDPTKELAAMPDGDVGGQDQRRKQIRRPHGECEPERDRSERRSPRPILRADEEQKRRREEEDRRTVLPESAARRRPGGCAEREDEREERRAATAEPAPPTDEEECRGRARDRRRGDFDFDPAEAARADDSLRVRSDAEARRDGAS